MNRTVNKPSFIFFSILMFIAGIVVIFAAFVLLATKLKDNDATRILVYISMILMLAYGVFEIVAGIASVSENRRITNQSGCVTLTKLAIIFCIIQMILAAFNGIMVWQLALIFVTGILIPIIYLIVSKRGRVKKPIRRNSHERK